MTSLGWRNIIKNLKGRKNHEHLTGLGMGLGTEKHPKECDILGRGCCWW